MASIACNGCTVKIQNTSVSTSTGYVGSWILTGQGYGNFGCAGDVRLGTINLYYTNTSAGLCQQLTGSITPTGISGQAGSSVQTGCTGTRDCTVNLLFYIQPNINLYNQFPNSAFAFTMINYCQGNYTGISISGNPTSGSNYYPGSGYLLRSTQGTTNPCGTVCGYIVDGFWTVPYGFSGIIQGWTGFSTECTYCSPYEMVSLP